MDNIINKDSIILDIAEKENVANVLVGNFASQCMNIAQAKTDEEMNEFRVGLEIASKQLGSFISSLIAENGNLQLNCDQGIIEVPCNNPDYKKKPETAAS